MNRFFYDGNVLRKTRIDQLLTTRGLCTSREQAQRAIMAGRVTVDGHRAEKPGLQVSWDAQIEIQGAERYVGRGGLKLEAALEHFQVSARANDAWTSDPRRADSPIAFFSMERPGFMPSTSDGVRWIGSCATILG